MALYSAKMYNNSVYEEMLVKKKHRSRHLNPLQSKLKSTNGLAQLKDEGLDDDDVQEIIDEARTMKKRKASFLRSLFHINCFNSKRNNRKVRLQRQTVEHFDSLLDIRSFVSVHMNLAQLLWLLLNDKQRILFNHHR